jgi:SAM-dependent methyltransferase
MDKPQMKHIDALWRIYRRADRPQPWQDGGNLPWSDPAFSERMLNEHLDETHGAASRQSKERAMIVDWLWSKLELHAASQILDVTCGPGLYAVELAKRGAQITGVDFSPAAIRHARQWAASENVNERCKFVEQDIRTVSFEGQRFDAAIFLYGQLAVFPVNEARHLLEQLAQTLKPGGILVVELLNQDKVDKEDSNWWFSDDTGLWGNSPFIHLGERFWVAEEAMSIERFHILRLDDGALEKIVLCDQTYAVEDMVNMMQETGFANVDVYPSWNGLPLYDATEWILYVAHIGQS